MVDRKQVKRNVLPMACGSYVCLFCYALLCVYSSLAIILKRNRKLVALLLFLTDVLLL